MRKEQTFPTPPPSRVDEIIFAKEIEDRLKRFWYLIDQFVRATENKMPRGHEDQSVAGDARGIVSEL